MPPPEPEQDGEPSLLVPRLFFALSLALVGAGSALLFSVPLAMVAVGGLLWWDLHHVGPAR